MMNRSTGSCNLHPLALFVLASPTKNPSLDFRLAKLSSFALLSSFICLLFLVQNSLGSDNIKSDIKADTKINSSYRINSNKNTETIEIGNTKTNNYNIHESSYQPTLILNVPKPKKLRKARRPTELEFAIKRKILDVYELAKQEATEQLVELNPLQTTLNSRSQDRDGAGGERFPHLDHLGRIIKALNPKYIATERVRRVAFADSSDLDALVPLPDHLEQPSSDPDHAQSEEHKRQVLHLDFNETARPVPDQLTDLAAYFSARVHQSPQFIRQLEQSSTEQLNPTQLAFRRLLLCLAESDRCDMQPATGGPQTEVRRREKLLEQRDDNAQLTQDIVSNVLRDVGHLVGETASNQSRPRLDAASIPDFKRGLKQTLGKAKQLNRHSADNVRVYAGETHQTQNESADHNRASITLDSIRHKKSRDHQANPKPLFGRFRSQHVYT